jgi:hypothetical protein
VLVVQTSNAKRSKAFNWPSYDTHQSSAPNSLKPSGSPIRRALEQMGVPCVYKSCTNHRPQSREAQNFGLDQKFDPGFISWNQQSPDHANQRRRPLAAQVPRSHSRATDQSSEFRIPALDRGDFLFFLSSNFLKSELVLLGSSPPCNP